MPAISKEKACVVVAGENMLAELVAKALPRLRFRALVFQGGNSSQERPQAVVVVDDFPSSRGGLVARLAEVRQAYPQGPICVLSSADYSSWITTHRGMGIRGFVHTSVPVTSLASALRLLAVGGECIHHPIRAALRADPTDTSPKLTTRDWQICELLKKGHSNKTIAETLGLTSNTVKVHMSKLMRKLNVQTRLEAALRSNIASGADEAALHAVSHAKSLPET